MPESPFTDEERVKLFKLKLVINAYTIVLVLITALIFGLNNANTIAAFLCFAGSLLFLQSAYTSFRVILMEKKLTPNPPAESSE